MPASSKNHYKTNQKLWMPHRYNPVTEETDIKIKRIMSDIIIITTEEKKIRTSRYLSLIRNNKNLNQVILLPKTLTLMGIR